MATIEERVIRLTQNILAYDDEMRAAVTPTASFIDDLDADSLDLVQIVMAIEEEFDIEVPDAEAELVFTVSDAAKLVARKTAPHSAVPR